MSTLVAVKKGGTAVLGSDSMFTMGSIKISPGNRVNHHKIHQVGNAYVGFTGWSLMHNVFEDIVEKHPASLDFRSRKHILKSFLSLHHLLKEDYYFETREKSDQPVESSQWDCLIACPSGIFSVDSYRTVTEYDKFWADGSGLRFALGAMHALYDSALTAEQIAASALEAACALDDGSGPPLITKAVKLKPKA